FALLEVDLELDVTEDVEAELMEESDRLSVPCGRPDEHSHRARCARFLDETLGERASRAAAARIGRDDDGLELRPAAVPQEAGVPEDTSVLLNDEEILLGCELAGDRRIRIQPAVRLDQLPVERTAGVEVRRPVVADDHDTDSRPPSAPVA